MTFAISSCAPGAEHLEALTVGLVFLCLGGFNRSVELLLKMVDLTR